MTIKEFDQTPIKTLIPIKGIDDVEEFNDIASQIFTEYLKMFTEKEGLIREANENDWVDEDEISFLYTYKGQQLAQSFLNRLYTYGSKYFYDVDIEIESSLFQEW